MNRRPRAPATAPESREPRRGRTEEQAVLPTFSKKKVGRRKGEKVIQQQYKVRICRDSGCAHIQTIQRGCNRFRLYGGSILSWQNRRKPLTPRFGPCGVPSLRYCYGAVAAYGSLRSPTSRACTARRVCCAHAPSQYRNEASLTSRFVAPITSSSCTCTNPESRTAHAPTQNVRATSIATSGRPSVGVVEGAARSATCVKRRREM